MDVYSLINSKDIAEYLREIHYEFNSLETAWLIWKNDYLTFDEKKKKWHEVIETMPDCEVSEREGWHTGWESLHQMLQEYMDLVDEIREDFEKDPEPGKYVYQNSYYDEIEQYNRAREVFPDFRSCAEDAKEDVFYVDLPVVTYWLERQAVQDVEDRVILTYRKDGAFMNVFEKYKGTTKENDLLCNSFEGIWLDIPTPFKKGDIVWNPRNPDPEERIVVVDGVSNWGDTELLQKSGDSSDMYVYGYLPMADGSVFYHPLMRNNYMDMEYYHGTFQEHEKILKGLSAYLKGKISLYQFLILYRKSLLDMLPKGIPLDQIIGGEVDV
ncbi:MAG: hypothetical protein J6B84_06825 [Eubacterium sp.]|nr:hypothetical protein [Eubacterium sp.]